jgi:hypothetical protein
LNSRYLTSNLKDENYKVVPYNKGLHMPNPEYFFDLYEHLWLPYNNAKNNNSGLGKLFWNKNNPEGLNRIKNNIKEWNRRNKNFKYTDQGLNVERRLDPVAMRIMEDIGLSTDLNDLFQKFHSALTITKPKLGNFNMYPVKFQMAKILDTISKDLYEKAKSQDVIIYPSSQDLKVNDIYICFLDFHLYMMLKLKCYEQL